MARPIDQFQQRTRPLRRGLLDRNTTRSTARAFAAAISALAISTLVISTSSDALTEDGTVAANYLSSGTVTITDDDEGQALFSLQDMAPGRVTEQCIEIEYQGSITPVDFRMTVSTDGELSPYLEMRVERGTGAAFDDCSSFDRDDLLFAGTVEEMQQEGAIDLQRILNQGQRASFRFVVELADVDDALDKETFVDFAWVVTPA